MKNKVLSGPGLIKVVRSLRNAKKKIVFTNGCFDIIHVGHIDYLSKARKLGDVLIVGLNSDSSVRSIKGPSRPVNNQRDRATVLAAMHFIDHIIIFSDPTPARLIRLIRPDVLVKGADWKIADIVGADLVLSYGGKVSRIPYIKGYSTSSVLKKIGN